MAKKRKVRASETSQPQSEPEKQEEAVQISQQEPDPDPEPEPEPEPAEISQAQAVPTEEGESDPEEIEEVEEVEDEEEESEEESGVNLNVSGEETKGITKTNDVVPAENKQANGGAEKQKNDDDEFEDEPLDKLLEPFSKDQMVILLKEAVTKHPDLMESVRKLADADPAHRKIFVHGLAWDTTAETLTNVFGTYGAIEDCKAVTDKSTGRSKGYGFILFKHKSGAQKALKEPQKKIGNRMTSCQMASAGPVSTLPPTVAPPPMSEYTQRKIFVSNVSAELDPYKLLDFFAKFGEIEEGPLGLDKQTGKPKGFCLFVYKSVESARKALEEPHKIFEGHTLHCQRAIDGPKYTKNYPNQQQQYQEHYGGVQQHYHHQQHQQPYYGHEAKRGKYSSSSGVSPGGHTGHLMAPAAGHNVGFNPAVAATPALTPELGQALSAILASQGAGLGIGNFLGGIGASVNQGGPPVMNNAGYGGQGGGGYGTQAGMQGSYHNPQMGSQSGVRPQQGGGYMGHGH